jgi:3-carboxy-cis,cis-muconate cycloisomerase
MPQKRNPVASVLVLGCARRAPGLLATMAAATEHELQRAAGAWHAEWEPLTDLLRITGSAASWSAVLLAGLQIDAVRMRAALDASGGLLVAAAADRAARQDTGLAAALLADPDSAAALSAAGIGAADLAAATDPGSYLGACSEFVRRALAAHDSGEWQPAEEGAPSGD